MKNIKEIEAIAYSWSSLREEAINLNRYTLKRKKKPKPPPELYCRPWESIVIKPKAK